MIEACKQPQQLAKVVSTYGVPQACWEELGVHQMSKPHCMVLVLVALFIVVFVVIPSSNLPNRFRLSVYPMCVLKSMGYTRSRNHGNHRHAQHHASTMHDNVNLRHQDPHSVYPMHGVMVHNESTPSFVVVVLVVG